MARKNKQPPYDWRAFDAANIAKALATCHKWWRASWNPPALHAGHERRTRGIID
jgi:hypothetical protein